MQDPSLAEQGWQQTTVTSSYTGYLPAEELGKNFFVPPGSIIRVDPDPQAPALTTCEPYDHMRVSGLSQNRNWAIVRFTKAVTVYYAIHERPETVAIDTPRPQHKPKLQSNKPAVNIMPDSLEPESAVWIPGGEPLQYKPSSAPAANLVVERPPGSSAIMVQPSEQQALSPAASEDATIVRNLAGILQRERGSEPAHYPLRLYQGNKCIAYVDMSGIFVSDLRPYLAQKVLIQGRTRRLGPDKQATVIQARSIQLTE